MASEKNPSIIGVVVSLLEWMEEEGGVQAEDINGDGRGGREREGGMSNGLLV